MKSFLCFMECLDEFFKAKLIKELTNKFSQDSVGVNWGRVDSFLEIDTHTVKNIASVEDLHRQDPDNRGVDMQFDNLKFRNHGQYGWICNLRIFIFHVEKL